MTYDGSNRKQVRAKEKEAALAENNRIAYSRRIMQDQPGRKWMHDLLEKCQMFGEPFIQGSPDGTAHNLGKQIIGKQLFADIVNHSPTEYILMMQEASIKDAVNDRRYSDDRSTGGEQPGSSNPGRDAEGRISSEYDPYVGDEARGDDLPN